jgi:hypothetical protein
VTDDPTTDVEARRKYRPRKPTTTQARLLRAADFLDPNVERAWKLDNETALHAALALRLAAEKETT